MKTTLLLTLRTVLLAGVLSTSALVSARAASDTTLAPTGAIAVKAVGPYVEVGSYRIWVSSHLGKPSATLADGTWLYNNFAADGSEATGTLLVRFNHGQVSELQLVSPAYVAALRTAPRASGSLIAFSQR